MTPDAREPKDDRALVRTIVLSQFAPPFLFSGVAVGLPVVAVPTTYAGSEMTSIWGVTDGDVKRTGRDRGVAPRLVVYDPNLTLSLPASVSGVVVVTVAVLLSAGVVSAGSTATTTS